MHACTAGILVKIINAKLEMENKLKLGRGFGPQTLIQGPSSHKKGVRHLSAHLQKEHSGVKLV